MGWGELAALDLVCRPLDDWPGQPTEVRQTSRFEARFTATVETLARELKHLKAERIVLQVDLRPSQIRVDGLPRADARAGSPGVVLGFDSVHGPLRYACDRFVASRWKREGGEDWQHNLRAIALGLEHLRAVDRYGITKRGEQYRGWAELPSGIAQPATHMTSNEARDFIREHADAGWDIPDESFAEVLDPLYRAAAKRLHPDAGGDPELFQRLKAARDLLVRDG